MRWLLLAAFAPGLACALRPTTPQAALAEWRASRVSSLQLDASRFHFQVLFVDDDNRRARVAECCTEVLAAWGDAGWWIYPHSATINASAAAAVDGRLAAVLTACDFDSTRAAADGAVLDATDLDAYDLIVCADAATRTAVLDSFSDEFSDGFSEEAREQSIRELGDFASVATPEARALLLGLDESLAARARARFDGGAMDLAAADAATDRARFDACLESTVVCCANLVRYLMGTFDAAFVDKFNDLLRAHFYDQRHLRVDWREADDALRRHVVTGALDPRERERLFEAHMAALREKLHS